jgi:cytochrome oxidase assembly protein ShyY1
MTWCDIFTLCMCVLYGVSRWQLHRVKEKRDFYQRIGQATFNVIKANIPQERWNQWVRDYKEKEQKDGVPRST